MPYDLEISPRARLEIDDSLEWLGRYSEEYAVRWRNELLEHAALLRNNSFQYPIAGEAEDLGIELRELTFGKRKKRYRILYTIVENVVRIHHVRHVSRDTLRPDEFQI